MQIKPVLFNLLCAAILWGGIKDSEASVRLWFLSSGKLHLTALNIIKSLWDSHSRAAAVGGLGSFKNAHRERQTVITDFAQHNQWPNAGTQLPMELAVCPLIIRCTVTIHNNPGRFWRHKVCFLSTSWHFVYFLAYGRCTIQAELIYGVRSRTCPHQQSPTHLLLAILRLQGSLAALCLMVCWLTE